MLSCTGTEPGTTLHKEIDDELNGAAVDEVQAGAVSAEREAFRAWRSGPCAARALTPQRTEVNVFGHGRNKSRGGGLVGDQPAEVEVLHRRRCRGGRRPRGSGTGMCPHQLASCTGAAKQLRSPSKQQSVKAAAADADADLLA